jgi:hypothetical protein
MVVISQGSGPRLSMLHGADRAGLRWLQADLLDQPALAAAGLMDASHHPGATAGRSRTAATGLGAGPGFAGVSGGFWIQGMTQMARFF